MHEKGLVELLFLETSSDMSIHPLETYERGLVDIILNSFHITTGSCVCVTQYHSIKFIS